MKYNTNHTFSVCAYKESEYLEKCIKSLLKQEVKSNIIICTSTPCEFISNIATKYNLELFVRDGKSDIRDDWNFAYDKAETDLVTVAHQDDYYRHDYVENLLKKASKYNNKFLFFFTDYMPLKNDKIGKRDANSKIRRLLRWTMKVSLFANIRFFKKSILMLGNSICCPTATYNKKALGESFFTSELKFNIDWDTFYKLANMKGRFIYVDKPLTYYRIHDSATSKEFIDNNGRVLEDTIMFNKFWPKWVTKIIMKYYVKAYDTYFEE